MPPLQQTQGNKLSYKVPGFVDEAHQSVPPASLVIEHQRAAHPRHPWLARKQTDTFPQTTASALHHPFASFVRPPRRIGAPELPLSAEGTGRPPVCMQAIVALSSPPSFIDPNLGHSPMVVSVQHFVQAPKPHLLPHVPPRDPSSRHAGTGALPTWPNGACSLVASATMFRHTGNCTET
ncbi:hypothetical protein ACCO45_000935 [Purpureocillium lilacinum]|uniref:Uncharacterized protein n=1 Tax=Purpureocillium lilacinum TaxID=33203 RepID=A0ACC4E5K6_PURLI